LFKFFVELLMLLALFYSDEHVNFFSGADYLFIKPFTEHVDVYHWHWKHRV